MYVYYDLKNNLYSEIKHNVIHVMDVTIQATQ
jgi:hypothetical protein